MRTPLFILAGLAFATTANAQTRALPAESGPLGIYVATSGELVSSYAPQHGVTNYIVERKSAADWEMVSSVSAPVSLDDFRERLHSFEEMQSLNSPISAVQPSSQVEESIWKRYEQYHLLDSLGYWGSTLGVRIAMGAMILDTNVQQGQRYTYRVSTGGDSLATVGESNTATFLAATKQDNYSSLKPLNTMLVARTKSLPAKAILYWSSGSSSRPQGLATFRKDLPYGEYVATPLHWIFAQPNGKEKENRIIVEDTTIEANRRYAYRVMPCDYYGNLGTMSDSLAVSTAEMQGVPLPDHITTTIDEKASTVRLTWRLPKRSSLFSLHLYRGETMDGPFSQIALLTGSDTDYTDKNILPEMRYFYYIVMEDAQGNLSAPSAKIFGIPKSEAQPIPATAVRAITVPQGARISWQSKDPGTQGFYVMRGIGARGMMTPISSIILAKETDSTYAYIDTLVPNLDPGTYIYAVQSESISHVRGGVFDTAYYVNTSMQPVPAPASLHVTADVGRNRVFWSDMRIAYPTLRGYNVYRREVDAEGNSAAAFVKLNKKPIVPSRNFYYDSSAVGYPSSTKSYQYTVTSLSLSDVESARSVTEVLYAAVVEPVSPPAGLRASQAESGIELTWDLVGEPGSENGMTYAVYRSSDAGSKQLTKTTQNTYVDQSAPAGELVTYTVSAIPNAGTESEPSEEVSIRNER